MVPRYMRVTYISCQLQSSKEHSDELRLTKVDHSCSDKENVERCTGATHLAQFVQVPMLSWKKNDW